MLQVELMAKPQKLTVKQTGHSPKTLRAMSIGADITHRMSPQAVSDMLDARDAFNRHAKRALNKSRRIK
jgi:hypothetical protein